MTNDNELNTQRAYGRISPSIERHHRFGGRPLRATLLTHLEAGERYEETVHNEALGRDVTSMRVVTACGLDAAITGTTRAPSSTNCAECLATLGGPAEGDAS